MQADYLKSVIQQFQYYKMLGDKTMAQLSDKQMLWKYNDASNSMAVMVKHLWGNMMSRWTDFLTTDGEKEFRNRDEEFELSVGTALQGSSYDNNQGSSYDNKNSVGSRLEGENANNAKDENVNNAKGENKYNREAMVSQWEEGWACLFKALESINEENFDTVIYIRNQGHTIPEAINRQMMHYAYHIGQMVYLGRMMKSEDWESLSIPKGNSKAYNAGKFSQEKGKRHFTEEYLK